MRTGWACAASATPARSATKRPASSR